MSSSPPSEPHSNNIRDFHHEATRVLAPAALLLVAPFAINNLIQQRYLIGIGTLVVVLVFAGTIRYAGKQRHPERLIGLGLVPTIIILVLQSIQVQGIIGAVWCYPILIAFFMVLPEYYARWANGALIITALPVAWTVLDPTVVVRLGGTWLMVSIFTGLLVRVIHQQQQELQRIAITDPLTGTLNRSHLDRILDESVQRYHRTGAPMALIALDLDHFKSINDTHGHDVGDQVLRSVGAFLSQRCRITDRVFRLGGEEFLILLPDTNAEGAQHLAEELRASIASLKPIEGCTITASLGVVSLQPRESWQVWLKRADQRMYQAKIAGRNRVVAAKNPVLKENQRG